MIFACSRDLLFLFLLFLLFFLHFFFFYPIYVFIISQDKEMFPGCGFGRGVGCNHLQQESSEAVLQNKMKPPDLY